jgi:hypothetical protein
MSKAILTIVIGSLLFLPLVAGADVKIYLDETRKEYVTVDELDCKVYEGKNGLTIGFKAGTYFFGIGPEFSIGQKNQINWDQTVQGIIVKYKELCTRFNTGAMTMKEYSERIKEIDAIAKDAMEFQEKITDRMKKRSDGMLSELDSETGKGKKSEDEIGRRIQEIGLKVEKLP